MNLGEQVEAASEVSITEQERERGMYLRQQALEVAVRAGCSSDSRELINAAKDIEAYIAGTTPTN